MDFMSEPASTNFIERYLRARGRRYFRGRHDDEYFFVADTHLRRLHVHLETCPAHPDVFTVRVTPACFFPAADRAQLTRVAERWNQQNSAVTAVVHESSDPQRIGVAATKSHSMADFDDFAGFARFVDSSLAAAIDLFDQLSPAAELPSTPLLLDAG
jgi:hypothetical protein